MIAYLPKRDLVHSVLVDRQRFGFTSLNSNYLALNKSRNVKYMLIQKNICQPGKSDIRESFTYIMNQDGLLARVMIDLATDPDKEIIGS